MFWERRLNAFISRLSPHNLPLRIILWNGAQYDLGEEIRVCVTFKTPAALRHSMPPSLQQLGEAYVEGEIDVEGCATDIIDLAVNLSSLWGKPGSRDHHHPRRSRHTRELDAEAISYHYDVSNEFYSLWLDREMVYSCAYFRKDDATLEEAQEQKIDHILRKLAVHPGDRLLDVGCGWGTLILRAVEKFGAHAVGITLSRNQYEFARERIIKRGLQDRCEVKFEDYRDVSGTFDRIASVGMFEHVGLKNLRGYFEKMRTLLADGGTFLNHGITSADPESGGSPFGGGVFIGRYVFPHGELPHLSLVLKEMCTAGFEPVDAECLRRHYAMTLREWARRYEEAGERLREIAGEKRYRAWRIYLAGCAYAFAHNWISVYQVLATRANDSTQNILPLTREYMYADG